MLAKGSETLQGFLSFPKAVLVQDVFFVVV